MQPLIAVTMGSLPGDETRPHRLSLNVSYVRAVEAVGGVPVLIAPEMEPATVSALMGMVSGVVLTGGEDVDPSLYGEAAHEKTGPVSPARDAMELAVIREALSRDIPLLPICRGLQMLNVALGGSLHQHVPDVYGDSLQHAQTAHGFGRAELTHGAAVSAGSKLAEVLGAEAVRVNSMHHQSLARMGAGLVATAVAEDGCVEGAEMAGQRWVVGVQWHPEEFFETVEHGGRLFSRFMDAVRG